jgi:cobalt/nickel transport system permease protein
MQVRFRLLPHTDSILSRLDDRWRLAALLLGMIVLAVIRQPLTCLLGLGLAGGVVALARVPLRWLLERLAAVMLLVALFAVPLAILGRPTEAMVIALKGLSLTLLASVMLVTAPVERSAQAAQALGMPGLLVHLITLTYRYVFLLAEEFDRLRLAIRLRGFRNRADGHSYATVAAATGTLLVRGAERAERVAAAMRCRGFEGRFPRGDEGHTGPAEVLTLLLAIAVVAVLVAVEWWR